MDTEHMLKNKVQSNNYLVIKPNTASLFINF